MIVDVDKKVIEFINKNVLSAEQFINSTLLKEVERVNKEFNRYVLIGKNTKDGKTYYDALAEYKTKKTISELEDMKDGFVGYQEKIWMKL
jgi:hypothetical protein